MNLFKKLKAQIALEALIIFGVFIIGVVIFATFYFQSITPKDNVDFEFGSDRVFNKTPNTPLVIIDDPNPEDPDYPDDPEPPEEYTFTNLVLILDPETSSLVNQDFNVIARINSNYDSANVDLIEVTKYDDISIDYSPNSSCKLNGVYASSFSNAGTLTPLDSNHLSNSFTFSCNSPGQYNFKFTVSNDNEIIPLVKNLEQSGYTDGKEIEVGVLCLAGQPGGGTGTEEDPKTICTPKELHDVRDHMDWYYVLGQDIDLNHTILSNDPTATWYDDVNGWRPIGSCNMSNPSFDIYYDSPLPFTGFFDGNNYSIENLYINRPNNNAIGLFGTTNYLYNSPENTLKNLFLNNVNITGRDYVGALVGDGRSLEISNVRVTGNLYGLRNVAGLVAYGSNLDVYNSHTEVNVIAGPSYGSAGFIGTLNHGNIIKSSSKGTVLGEGLCGGFIGNFLGNISLSYSNVDVSCVSSAGGFAALGEGSINNCYSTGSVESNGSAGSYNRVGGFIGRYEWDNISESKNNYTVSVIENKVVAPDLMYGGFSAACNPYSMNNNFWDVVSGELWSAGHCATAKTTTEMTTQSTYNDWNFTDVWQIEEGCYPILKENPQEPICPQVEKVSTPVADPIGGSYTTNQYVTLSTDTPDAVIYYTLNGVDPTPPSVENKYTQPILIIPDKTLKARAYKQGMEPSDIITETYVSTGLVNVPNFNPDSSCNVSTSVINLTLSTYTPGATIRYTLDGSEPTESSPLYLSPITINTTTTIKAKAFRSGWTPSATSTKTYRVEPSWNYCSSILNNGVYHISQPQHLNCVRANLDGNFVLDNDIDLAGINFEPIGSQECPFKGTFDGQSKTINNLSIVHFPFLKNVGLFGYSYFDSIIKNTELTNINILKSDSSVQWDSVGGLIGKSYGVVSNCSVSGIISVGSNVVNGTGGLVGSLISGSLSECIFNGSVSGEFRVGGLVGYMFNNNNNNLKISNSKSQGSVYGYMYVGGLVGRGVGKISNCFSSASISGNQRVGGFIGDLMNGDVSNSYSLGDVTRLDSSYTTFGGFLGYSTSHQLILNNYSVGKIVYLTGQSPTNNGFSSFNLTNGVNNFWDIDASQQTTSPAGATGKTTSQMKTQGTFTDWDFTNIWAINPTANNGYPYLRDNPPQ